MTSHVRALSLALAMLAVIPASAQKEIRASDISGLKAAHGMPVIVTGNVARVVKSNFGGWFLLVRS